MFRTNSPDFYAQIVAVASTVQELHRVPQSRVYTALCAKFPGLTLADYRRIISFVIDANMIRRDSNALVWIGDDFRITKISQVE